MTNKDKDFYNSKKSTQEESGYKDKLSDINATGSKQLINFFTHFNLLIVFATFTKKIRLDI